MDVRDKWTNGRLSINGRDTKLTWHQVERDDGSVGVVFLRHDSPIHKSTFSKDQAEAVEAIITAALDEVGLVRE